MQIPNYTRGLAIERATPNTVQLGQIDAAGAVARGVSQVADIGVQVTQKLQRDEEVLAQKLKKTNDDLAINSKVIEEQMKDGERNELSQEENAGTPQGYAERQREVMTQRVEDALETLDNDAQKASVRLTLERLNVAQNIKNINWENTTTIRKFKNTADIAISNLVTTVKNGGDEIHAQAGLLRTVAGLKDVLAPDELAKYTFQALEKMKDAKKVRKEGEAYSVLDGGKPQQLKADIDAGQYNDVFDAKEKLDFKDRADSAFKKLADDAAIARSIEQATKNPKIHTDYINGETNFADISALVNNGKITQEAATTMRKGLLRRNPASQQRQQDAIVEIQTAYDLLNITTKKGKKKYSGSLEDILRLQSKVMTAQAKGEIKDGVSGSWMNRIISPLLDKVVAEEGYDDKGFFDGTEPYDVAFQAIQDKLERTGEEDNTPLKAKMLLMAVTEADKMDIEKVKDPDERDKMLKALAKRVLVKYGESENPVNRTLDDSPNANIKPDGSVIRNGDFDTDLKADAKAKTDFIEMTSKDGKKWRKYSDGRIEERK